MSDNDPWCPTCSGRKGIGMVCDRCYARLPDELKDAVIHAKEALWRAEGACLSYLRARQDTDNSVRAKAPGLAAGSKLVRPSDIERERSTS